MTDKQKNEAQLEHGRECLDLREKFREAISKTEHLSACAIVGVLEVVKQDVINKYKDFIP